MNLTVASFSARDWMHLALLLAAEGALTWLIVNLFVMPTESVHGGMIAGTVAMLVIVATVLPRLCHDRGIWGMSYSIVVMAGVVVTTLLAVNLLSFPEYSLFDRQWIDEARRALIRESSQAAVSVWLVVFICAVIWWRGVTRPRPEIDSGLLLLKAGSAGLVLSAGGHALLDGGLADRHVSAAVLLFFVAALLAIAMMRLHLAPWQAPGRWLESVLLPVTLIVAPAALLAGLLTRDLSGMVDLLLDPVVFVLTIVLRVLSWVLVIVAMAILIPLVWLFSLLPVSQPRQEGETPVEFARATVESAAKQGSELPDLFRYVVAFALLVLIFAGLARFRLRFGYQESDDDPDHFSSRVQGSLLKDLGGWLRGIFDSGGRSAVDPLAALRGDKRWEHTIVIRERYADFLRWSREHGLPRSPATTPDEHDAHWVQRAGEQHAEAISTMTTLYDRARYGHEPMTSADAQNVEAAWQVLTSETGEAARR